MNATVVHCPSWEVDGEKKFSLKRVQAALKIGHRITFIQDRAQFGWEELRSLDLDQVKELLKMRLFLGCCGANENNCDYSRANFNRLFRGIPTKIQGQEFDSLSAFFESKQVSVDEEFRAVLEVLYGNY